MTRLLPLLRRPGVLVVSAFFLLNYFVPLVGNMLLADGIVSIYYIFPPSPYSLAFLFGAFGLFLASQWLPDQPGLRLPRFRRLAGFLGARYLQWRLPFLAGALGLGTWNFNSGLTGYRYASMGLSEVSSPLLLAMITLSAVLTADFVYSLFVRHNDGPRPPARCAGDWLLAAALMVMSNGTIAMFQGLLALAYAVSPRWLATMMFSAPGLPAFFRLARSAVLGLLTAGLLCGAWFFGEGLKARRFNESLFSSINRAAQQAMADAPPESPRPARRTSRPAGNASTMVRSSDHAREMSGETAPPRGLIRHAYYFVERNSIYYYSLLNTLDSTFSPAGDGTWPLVYPIRTMLFRFDYVLGRPWGVPKPPISSLMQLNYQSLATDPDPASRQGSSAGVLASFNYIAPFPLNLFLGVGYLWLVARLLDSLLRRHAGESLSLFGVLYLLLHTLVLFQSPPDFLLLFDDATIYAALLLGIALANRPREVTPPAAAA